MEADYGLFSKNREAYDKDQAALLALRHIWQNGGTLPNGEFIDLASTFKVDMQNCQLMKDNFSSDHPLLTSRVIQEIGSEAIEPTAVLANYIPTIKLNRAGGILTVPSWSSIHAADVAEGAEYPSAALDISRTVTAAIGKVGVGVHISEEMIKHSEYDIIKAHLSAGGAALKRRKEQKIADALIKQGTVIFDNNSTSYSSTEGRNSEGSFNGTVTLEDFFEMHETMTSNGFNPNTLIIHPNSWMIFAVESIARLFGLQRGSGWSADPSSATKGTNLARLNSVPTTFPSDWNIVVSPYLPYLPAGGASSDGPGGEWPLTDIIMCDANAIGVIIDNGDGVRTQDFNVPERDIRKINFSERYGIGIMNDGKAIGLMKNVSVGRGVDFWENTVHNVVTLADTLTGALGTTVVTGQI